MTGSSRWLWAWLLIIFASVAVYPALTQDVAAHAYDAASTHVFRGPVYAQVVNEGVLFPRWTQFLHLGLGSPVLTFHPPLAYALLDVLARLGVLYPLGWRLLIAGGLLAACAGTYRFVVALSGRRWPALLAAALYLYAPYVLRNAFERGSAETFSMFLYPWVFWALWRLGRRPDLTRFILATLLWAGCIGFHVLGPLMLAPFATLFALGIAWRYRIFLPLLALLAGGCLTAPIWAPILAEQSYVHVQRDFGHGVANPAAHPIPLDHLLAAPAIYDVSRDNNEIGDRLGLLQVVMLPAGLLAALCAWRKRRTHLAWAIGAAAIAGLGLAWLLTAAADPIWRDLAAGLERLQYRSRLLGLQALFAAVAGGLCLGLLSGKRQRVAALSLAGLALLAAAPSLYAGLQHRYASFDHALDLAQVRAAEIRSGGTAFTLFGEFTPRWRTEPFDDALLAELGPDFAPQQRPLAHAPDTLTLLNSAVHNGAWDLSVQAAEPATLTLHLLYYPRWQAWVDGQSAPLGHAAGTGYAQVRVGAGTHHVRLRYGRSTAEWAGLTLAALTVAALAAAGVIRHRRPAAARRAPRLAAADHDPPPSPWLLAGLTALLLFKFAYVDPATTWLRCVSTAERVCGAQATVDVAFAGAPRLRGYTVSAADVRRGGEVRVDLYWQGEADADHPSSIAHRPSSNSLSSFVHIRRSQPEQAPSPVTGGDIWAQTEHSTPGGLLTTEFLPGKLYKDEFRVRIPADMPPGAYFLEVGWFDPASGEQLDPAPETVAPPLKVLWRSILLPSLEVE